MARPLVIGNGQFLICYDQNLVMRDLYYPHVGQWNHIVGRRNQIGFWVDGELAWLGDEGWERRHRYRSGTLVAHSTAVHSRLGLEVEIESAVHQREPILIQRVRMADRMGRGRDLRLFATFDFDLDETDVGDTALWEPELKAILHHKRRRCFLIGAQGPMGGIDQYATGRKRFMGAEGTWRDAEDGRLEGHPISQGAVDSTIRLMAPLHARGSAEAFLWLVCATSFEGAERGHRLVREAGPGAMLAAVGRYWEAWAEPRDGDVSNLPPRLQEAYRRSLLIIRTQVDNGGAIIAANDSDIRDYNRDHYSYMWPRDGALVAHALDRAGFPGLTRSFYRFCAAGLSRGGYLLHKYNPDGSPGSSWHPRVGPGGVVQLPIQEDETALVLWALGRHYRLWRDLAFIDSLWEPLIRPAADFLDAYRDERTALPRESYDLWEERRGTFTFTTAAVVAGLGEAAHLAGALGDLRRARRYAAAAAETQAAMERCLWSVEHGRFLRGVSIGSGGELVPDLTLDASVAGLFLLGVLPAADPRVERTMQAVEAGLRVPGPVGGIARYAVDYYFRMTDDGPGNPWLICTLWLARWHIQRARSRAELQPGLHLIEWALDRALETGVLPEQVHPQTGAPLSVAPLTWSHSTLCEALLDLAERLRELPE